MSVAEHRTDPGRNFEVLRPVASIRHYGERYTYKPAANDTVEVFANLRAPVGGFGKRAFDLLLAVGASICLSPLFLLIMLAIKLHDGGPVFYRHRRVGHNCSPLYCWKFRTMVTDAEQQLARHLAVNPEAAREWERTQKLKKDPRVTGLGIILRKTSLDELPQLLNIIKGEMSFVGPRPIVRSEMMHYGPDLMAYFKARPGLTGQWQVSGRNDVSYEARVTLDLHYIEGWSFRNDVRILLKTFVIVVSTRGCY